MTKNKLPTTNGTRALGLLSDIINDIVRARRGTAGHKLKPSRFQDPHGDLIDLTGQVELGPAGTSESERRAGPRRAAWRGCAEPPIAAWPPHRSALAAFQTLASKGLQS